MLPHKVFVFGLDVFLFIAVLHVYQVTGAVSSVNIVGDLTVDENLDISYTCKAACTNGSCIYTWPKVNGLTYEPSSNSLKVKNVQRKAGGGRYIVTCSVTDKDGVALTDTTELEVFYGPDSVTISPGATKTIVEGHTHTQVACTADGCHPPCNLTWKNGSATVSTTGILFDKTEAGRYQTGSYACTAKNIKKNTPTTESAFFNLTVNYPPVVNVVMDSKTGALTCRAEGVPKNYEFQKWNHAFEDVNIRVLNGIQSGNTFSYKFTNLSYMNRGTYTCKATNDILPKGSQNKWISGTTTITPYDKPKLVSCQESYNVSKGATLPIELHIYANPPVSRSNVRLFDNSSDSISGGNVNIASVKAKVSVEFYSTRVSIPGQKVTATLNSVLEEYFGNLNIRLENGHGSESCDITLFPEGPPDPPVDLHVGDTQHDEVTLTFRSGFFNGGGQTIVVEIKTGAQGARWVNGSSVFAGDEKNVSLSVAIGGLDPETFYLFRCYSYNVYNRSDYADIVVNTTTLEAPLNAAVIIGGLVGGVFAVIVVIVVIVAICRRRRHNKDDRKAMYRDSHDMANKGSPNSWPASGENNATYMADEPAYENTTLKNGVSASSSHQTGGGSRPRKEEPIYTNQRQDSMSTEAVTEGDISQRQTQDTEHLVAIEGYLELENDNLPRVEEAYVTKGAPGSGKSELPKEEDYLNMEDFNAPALPAPHKHAVNETPGYLNVSKQIGLLDADQNDDDASQETPYLDMETAHALSGKGAASKSTKGYKYSKKYDLEAVDGTYEAMNSKNKAPSVASKPKPSQYQNLPLKNRVNKDPTVSPEQDPYMSMSTKPQPRNSIPSFHAPAPPGPKPKEELYENIKLG